MQPLLHRVQQPGLEERRHGLVDPLAEAELAGVGAGRRRRPRDIAAAGRSSARAWRSHTARRRRSPTPRPVARRASPRSAAPRSRCAAPPERSMACSGGPSRVADRPRTTHSSPAVRPDTSRSPRPRTAVTTQRVAVPGDGVRRERDARGAADDHPLDDDGHPVARARGRTRGPGRRHSPGRARRRPGRHRVRRPAPIRTSRRTTARRRPRRRRSSGRRTARRRGRADRGAKLGGGRGTRRWARPGRRPATMPAGTRTPAASSSPRRAALPPTSGASPDRTSRSRRIARPIASPVPHLQLCIARRYSRRRLQGCLGRAPRAP